VSGPEGGSDERPASGTPRPGIEPSAMAWTTVGCPVEAAVSLVGDRATFLIVREVGCGVRRFADMQLRTGIARDVLSRRLARMVQEGLLRRVGYQQAGARTRHEYRFTPKGFALYPVIVALWDWGVTWSSTHPDRGPAVEFTHRDCGEIVHTRLQCESGHDINEPRDVRPRPGPGAIPWPGAAARATTVGT